MQSPSKPLFVFIFYIDGVPTDISVRAYIDTLLSSNIEF